jgi:hypothetical protein
MRKSGSTGIMKFVPVAQRKRRDRQRHYSSKLPHSGAGSLVEVRYLYAYPGGSLYQPVYLGERNDVDTADSVKSFKFKQGEDDES